MQGGYAAGPVRNVVTSSVTVCSTCSRAFASCCSTLTCVACSAHLLVEVWISMFMAAGPSEDPKFIYLARACLNWICAYPYRVPYTCSPALAQPANFIVFATPVRGRAVLRVA